MHADVDTMQNDRTLGSITLSKADFDAARYLAAGSNGDSTLEGAVYDLYAAEDILHPNAFPALSITPRSPIPAATPSGIPPCLPTAHGSPTISRC